MKILITGGAGFIGSHVADAYIEAGHDVVVVDDLSNGSKDNVHPKADFRQIDIVDHDLVQKVVAETKPDIISHHAAKADIALIIKDPMAAFRTNIEGTANLLEAAVDANVTKIIFVSTSAAYGMPNYNPVDERHPLQPSTAYGTSKVVGERLVQLFGRRLGLDWTIMRYGNVYGPRQPKTGEAGVISIFARTLLAGKVPYITGDGEQAKDYVFVRDVVALNLAVLAKGSQRVYNCGTGVATSVNDIFETLANKVGFKPEPTHAAPRDGDCSFTFRCTRAEEELGWSAKTSLVDGMDATIEFERQRLANAS